MIRMTIVTAIAATFVASAAAAAPVSESSTSATLQNVSPLAMFDKVMKPKGPRTKCTSNCRLKDDKDDQKAVVSAKKKVKSFNIGMPPKNKVKKPKKKQVFPSRH